MIYIGLSALVIIFVFFNVIGLFKGIKEIPEGEYRDELWKYKKMEVVEKAVQCAILVIVIISMKFTEEVALVALIAMAVMMTLEYFFAKYIRKSLVCPKCGKPIWNGNYIVIIQAFKWCPFCQEPLIEMPDVQNAPNTEENDAADIAEDNTESENNEDETDV